MAIVVGNTSTSGDPGTAQNSYSYSHECAVDSNLLIVTTRAKESTDADRPVSGVTYDGNPLSLARAYHVNGVEFSVEIWYLVDPTTESSLTIEITHDGKVTDPSSGAVDFKNVDTDGAIFTGSDDVTGTGTSIAVDTSTGDAYVISMQSAETAVGNVTPANGTLPIDEVDTGSFTAAGGYEIADTAGGYALTNSEDYAATAVGIIAIPENLTVNINDSISIVDIVTLFFDLLRITINDVIATAEAGALSGKLKSNITDLISIAESITVAEFIVGASAIDRGSSSPGNLTYICLANPASENMLVTSARIWLNSNITGLIIGSFYSSGGSNYTCRDSESIAGEIAAGSMQTFADLNISFEAGDFIGCYFDSGGSIEYSTSGSDGVEYAVGEFIDADDETEYTLGSDDAISLQGFGTGVTGNLSKNIYDSIVVVEAINVFFDKICVNIHDSVTITESIIGLLDKIFVYISDSISVTEFIQNFGQLSASLVDSVSAVEGFSPEGHSLTDIYDSIKIAEALERLGYLSRDVNDSISIAEALSFLGQLSVDINDSVSIVEDLVGQVIALGFDVSIDDTITVAEFLGTLGYEYANINDSITVAEALSFLGLLVADVNDSITISESLNFLGYMAAIVSENITITENVARITTSYRTVNDEVSVNEALSFLGHLQTAINDNLTITESLTFLGLLNTDVFDSIVVAENLANNIYTAGSLTVNISDTITVAEVIQFAGYLQASISDTITVIDIISTGKADGFFRRPWCRRLAGPFGRGDVFQN